MTNREVSAASSWRRSIVSTGTAVVILALATAGQSAAAADGGRVRSPELVKRLTTVMTQQGLTAIATPDPQVPGQYVAAMLFPGVQLLVIRARSDESAYIDAEIAARRFPNVYAALQDGVRDSKLFVQDMGCDGVYGTPDNTPDIVYERGVDQFILDGDFKAARMSRQAYAKHIEVLDGRYAALLQLLIDATATWPGM